MLYQYCYMHLYYSCFFPAYTSRIAMTCPAFHFVLFVLGLLKSVNIFSVLTHLRTVIRLSFLPQDTQDKSYALPSYFNSMSNYPFCPKTHETSPMHSSYLNLISNCPFCPKILKISPIHSLATLIPCPIVLSVPRHSGQVLCTP